MKEYARYLRFGLAVASTFLQILHEEGETDYADTRIDEVVKTILENGGEVVDEDLQSLVVDIYCLYKKMKKLNKKCIEQIVDNTSSIHTK